MESIGTGCDGMGWDGMEWNIIEWNGMAWNDMVLDGMDYNGTEQHHSSAEAVYEQHMDMDIAWVFQTQIVNARLCGHLAALAICLLADHPQK